MDIVGLLLLGVSLVACGLAVANTFHKLWHLHPPRIEEDEEW